MDALQLRRFRNEITVSQQHAAEQLFGRDFLEESALALKYFPDGGKHTAEVGARTSARLNRRLPSDGRTRCGL